MSEVSKNRKKGEVARAQGDEGWVRPEKGPIASFFAPVKGYGITLSSMFRPVVTEQYPFEKRPTQARYHGRHRLNRYADGLEKCIGCELCAWACPADAIYVEGADNTAGLHESPDDVPNHAFGGAARRPGYNPATRIAAWQHNTSASPSSGDRCPAERFL